MSLAKELRKLADRIEGTGLFKARKMGIALKHLALFERVRAPVNDNYFSFPVASFQNVTKIEGR